jgi:hypothetical protein
MEVSYGKRICIVDAKVTFETRIDTNAQNKSSLSDGT